MYAGGAGSSEEGIAGLFRRKAVPNKRGDTAEDQAKAQRLVFNSIGEKTSEEDMAQPFRRKAILNKRGDTAEDRAKAQRLVFNSIS